MRSGVAICTYVRGRKQPRISSTCVLSPVAADGWWLVADCWKLAIGGPGQIAIGGQLSESAGGRVRSPCSSERHLAGLAIRPFTGGTRIT
jgi:hypothetical protein